MILVTKIGSTKEMNTNHNDMTVTIPGTIAVLPLSLNEKIVLAEVARNPKCSNGALAKLIGIGERGVKKVVQRLRLGGHLHQIGNGRARQLHLTFALEKGIEFTQPDISSKDSNRELCSVLPVAATSKIVGFTAAEVPLDQHYEMTMRTMDKMTRWPNCCALTFVRLLQPLIERVETEMGDDPKKEEIFRDLAVRQGAFIAMSMGEGLPKDVQRQLNERIERATPEELIEIRRRAVTGKLEDKTPLQLSVWCSESNPLPLASDAPESPLGLR